MQNDNASLNKKVAIDIFTHVSKKIEGMQISEAYDHLGAALGLVALAIEREHGVDRNSTFKMLTRVGHATVKELERATREKEH